MTTGCRLRRVLHEEQSGEMWYNCAHGNRRDYSRFGGDVVGGRHKRPEGQFKRGADGKWIVDSDTTHLNERGEYLQALVWAVKLLDADIERLPTHPDCVTDEEDRLMRRIAREVLL